MYIHISTHVHIHVFKGNFDICMYMNHIADSFARPHRRDAHTITYIYVYISSCPDSESLLPNAHTSPCYVTVAVKPRLKEEATAYS